MFVLVAATSGNSTGLELSAVEDHRYNFYLILNNDTPISLKLQDGDVIEAV